MDGARSILTVLALACVGSPAMGQTTRPATSAPSAPATSRVELDGGGHFWLQVPGGYASGAKPPLIICLHGTDDLAEDTLAFWAACGEGPPSVWVAPQGSGRGWAEADMGRLREMWANLENRLTFDTDRVLVAGYSAGGVMAFHWLYREAAPATAVVTLANYLPPTVTEADVAGRKSVPVFYGVGMADINHERMRAGLALLRDQGVRVTLARPEIGHRLSAEVAREAIAWFETLCRDAVRQRLDEAAAALGKEQWGAAAQVAEGIVAQRQWHDPADVERAESLLPLAMAWGHAKRAEAERLAAGSNKLDAVLCLGEIERAYAGVSLAEAARARRLEIEADPAVREALAAQARQRTEAAAMASYLDVQRLVAAGQFEEARRQCEIILAAYAGTPAAERADRLLQRLPRRNPR